ncbi:uncharacterized protein LOC128954987 [Oppia nitens]|uniref:uncharacterized protein LOC128954987 n=1 Tax=Oppia nitens TaxID=1686743 RepID=UPI0023DA522E|nr:uncharacterized protein LOC128954987 [Oppia nitens]
MPLSYTHIPQQWWPLTNRSALMMDNNDNNKPINFVGNGGQPDGIDIDAIRKHCIRSIGIIVIKKLDNSDQIFTEGSGVCVANTTDTGCLLLTNYHAVTHSPVVRVIYKPDHNDNRVYVELADVLYVEQHWDLALVRLQRLNSLFNPMPMATETKFGQPGCMFGHGQIAFTVHPGLVVQPSVQLNNANDTYRISTVPFAGHLPIVAHTAVNVPGFSGCPLIDTDGRLSGIVWGGFVTRGQITFAVDYQTVNEFMLRAISYVDAYTGINLNRLRNLYSMFGSSNRQLALILAKHYDEFDSNNVWFTIEELLPESQPLNIVNRFVMFVNDQPFTDIETIRTVLSVGDDSYPTIQLTLRSPMYRYNNRFDWKVNITSMSPDVKAFVF